MGIKKRVAILGGGMSGLTAIKACLEEGFEPVCLEGSDNIGGLWRYRDDDIDGRSSVMKSTVINTSKEVSAFSDFPPPKEYPNYMHNRHMCHYFELYAEHFLLKKHIRFGQSVTKVIPAPDYDKTGRWTVLFTTTDNGNQVINSQETFDGVMVCTGHHVAPHIPHFDGLDQFKGKVVHTHSYKVPDEFIDKNVMIVGTGNSGSDVAVELSAVSKQVYLSTRRGFWIINRVGPKGYPIDMTFATRAKIQMLPRWIQTKVMEKTATDLLDYELYGIKPAHAITAQHPTVSDALPNRIICGTVTIKGPIEKFVPEGVYFQGERKVVPLDGVVMATGYDAGYNFIDQSIAKINNKNCELYMYVFPPRLKHATLGFIGNAQPIGPLFPLSELQARWIVKIFKGDCKLPSAEEMLEDIRNRENFNLKNYISGTRHLTEVIGIVYCDQIAQRIGAKPNLWRMAICDPALFRKVFFGALVPYQFRLRGPHAWKGAREAIMSYESRVKAAFKTNSQTIESRFQNSKPFLKVALLVTGLVAVVIVRNRSGIALGKLWPCSRAVAILSTVWVNRPFQIK